MQIQALLGCGTDDRPRLRLEADGLIGHSSWGLPLVSAKRIKDAELGISRVLPRIPSDGQAGSVLGGLRSATGDNMLPP